MPNAFDDLVSMCQERQALNKDTVVAVCGPPGIGKTSFAIQLAEAINPENFSIEKNVLFYPSVERAKEMYKNLGKKFSIVFDESMLTMYKRLSQHASSIDINQFFSVDIRKNYNSTTIIVIEYLHDLDVYFRRSRVMFWVQGIERMDECLSCRGTIEWIGQKCLGCGKDFNLPENKNFRRKEAYVLMFMKDSSIAAKDPWRLYELDRIWVRVNQDVYVHQETRENWLKVAKKFRLFFGESTYSDLPAEYWVRYENARLKAKAEYDKSNPHGNFCNNCNRPATVFKNEKWWCFKCQRP